MSEAKHAPDLLASAKDKAAWIRHWLEQVVHVRVVDERGRDVNGYAAARIPDWDLRQKLAELEADIAAAESRSGVALISAERHRQVSAEGWTPEHDDGHGSGEMAAAATCYLNASAHQHQHNIRLWPWDAKWWKPNGRITNLVKAGALIAAEIDRLIRQDDNARAALAKAEGRAL